MAAHSPECSLRAPCLTPPPHPGHQGASPPSSCWSTGWAGWEMGLDVGVLLSSGVTQSPPPGAPSSLLLQAQLRAVSLVVTRAHACIGDSSLERGFTCQFSPASFSSVSSFLTTAPHPEGFSTPLECCWVSQCMCIFLLFLKLCHQFLKGFFIASTPK